MFRLALYLIADLLESALDLLGQGLHPQDHLLELDTLSLQPLTFRYLLLAPEVYFIIQIQNYIVFLVPVFRA